MTFIRHHNRIILIGEVANFIQLCNGTIHAKRTVGNNNPASATSCFLQFQF